MEGSGTGLKVCHVFADSFFFFKKKELLFILQKKGVWGSQNWSFFGDVINV